ncbi:unnamed protein product [Rotaria sp. Silwood2]|nr:unnamed protein product [Rotaria sp. Silwood2]CAF4778054.1 unnamed protein product [Rotaria sp. Silwood2]
MSNLEELCLNFVNSYGPIIDSGNLKENILNHMRKLNKFTFNIRSINALTELGHLPLDKDIQSTFWNFKNKEIISYIDYFEKSALFNYHIYSYPYRWTCYDNITNNFPGGIFRCVREISLYDEHPFEHNPNPEAEFLIVRYSHLTEIDLVETDECYVEEFLNNIKTYLSNDVYLSVDYDTLEKATDDFTKDATRINSSKIIGLIVSDIESRFVPKVKGYFPGTRIC